MEDPERSQSEPPQSQSAQTSNATTPSRRHKSPSRQPQSVSPALTQISTSDYGERESTKAEEYGDDYWLNESPTKPKHRHIVVIEEVEEEPVFGDEVASNRDDSLSPAQPSSQLQNTSPTISLSDRNRELDEPPDRPLPPPLQPLNLSPPIQSSSTQRSSASPPRRSKSPTAHASPSRSPIASTSALEASPANPSRPSSPVTPSPPQVAAGGRSLRVRTLAQLKPFSVEQAAYAKSLITQGWNGAVVSLPKPPGSELLCSKSVGPHKRARDDLNGWLEFEDGEVPTNGGDDAVELEPVGKEEKEEEEGEEEEEEEEEIGGEELLEREMNKRRERMWDAVEQGLGGPSSRSKQARAKRRQAGGRKTRAPESGDESEDIAWVEGGREWFDKRDEEREAVRAGLGKGKSRVSAETGKGKGKGKERDVVSASDDENSDSDGRPQDYRRRSREERKKGTSKLRALRASGRGKGREWDFLDRSADEDEDARPTRASKYRASSSERNQPSSSRPLAASTSATKSNTHKKKRKLHQDGTSKTHAESDQRVDKRFKSKPGKPLFETRRGGGHPNDVLDRQLLLEEFSPASSPEAIEYEQMEIDGDDSPSPSSSDAVDDYGLTSPGTGEKRKGLMGKKQRKFLSRMVPAVAAKKMLKDVDAMEREREIGGRWSGEETEEEEWGAREISRQRDEERVKKKAKEKKERRKKQRAETWAMDTGENIFRDEFVLKEASRSAAEVIMLDSSGEDRGELASKRKEGTRRSNLGEAERWASYSNFSVGFDIERLDPAKVSLRPLGFVRLGRLGNLLSSSLRLVRSDISKPFFDDLVLDATVPLADFCELLPTLMMRIENTVVTLAHQHEGGSHAVGEAMRWLGDFISSRLATGSEEAETIAAIRRLQGEIDKLQARFDTVEATSAFGGSLTKLRITFDWYLVDLATRIFQLQTSPSPILPPSESPSVSAAKRLLHSIRSLVRRLIKHGPAHTMQALKTGGEVTDPSVEAWLGIISLSLSPVTTQNVFDEFAFWELISQESEQSLSFGVKQSGGPVRGERASYTAMMLCAISQFSPLGYLGDRPRLGARWAVVGEALDRIQLELVTNSDEHGISNTSLARLDRYIWTLCARCLVLVRKWDWHFTPDDKLLTKLFALFQSRHLSHLSIEDPASTDFPSFLQDPELCLHHSPPSSFFDLEQSGEGRDTAFTIFLKLIVRTSSDLSLERTPQEQNRLLGRLFARLSPIVQKPWTRQSPELGSSTSTLVNHYSLLLTFIVLCPSTATQRLEQARRLLAFDQVSDEARKVCLRAITTYGSVFKRISLDLKPLVDWMGTVGSLLKSEIEILEATPMSATVLKVTWKKTVLALMTLRGVRGLLKALPAEETGQSRSVTYPDLSFLNPDWTSEILRLSLATDPAVGTEVLKLINEYLDARLAALPKKADIRTVETGESQDEYGLFDGMDFDDPALNALLGVAMEQGLPVGGQIDVKKLDLALARHIEMVVEPALYKLMGRVFVVTELDEPGPRIPMSERIQFNQQIVDCWIRCIFVLVENDLCEWGPFLRFGRHSWRNLTRDSIVRRDTGLLLAIRVLQHDENLFATFQEDIHGIWFQSIVAWHLTSQHTLTTVLLNGDLFRSPLLVGVPIERDDKTGRFNISQERFQCLRLNILQTVLQNLTEFLAPSTVSGSAITPSGARYLLGDLMTAANDNLGSIKFEIDKKKYAIFARAVLDLVKQVCGPAGVTGQSVPQVKLLSNSVAATLAH